MEDGVFTTPDRLLPALDSALTGAERPHGRRARRIMIGTTTSLPVDRPSRASMFRISHVFGTHRDHDRRSIAEMQALLEHAFPYIATQPDYITKRVNDQAARGYPVILLAAHGTT